jgi:hypothetical protein
VVYKFRYIGAFPSGNNFGSPKFRGHTLVVDEEVTSDKIKKITHLTKSLITKKLSCVYNDLLVALLSLSDQK